MREPEQPPPLTPPLKGEGDSAVAPLNRNSPPP
jgi:hypothetical protein